MSENSGSFHVRTADPRGCAERLGTLGFNGFVFENTPGWLTAVPFGGPAGLFTFMEWIAGLAAALSAPVLAYTCADDFFWGFWVWLPDGRSTHFMADKSRTGEDAGPAVGEVVDEAVLGAIVPVERVRALLVPAVAPGQGASEPAGEFARAVGLTEYSFLSPADVTEDPGDAVRRGGRQIGVVPAGEDLL